MISNLSTEFASDISPERVKELQKISQDLEASFLTEMLKSAKLGEPQKAFGGGIGEEHFSGLLTREYADYMAKSGGIGLSEAIFHSLVKHEVRQ